MDTQSPDAGEGEEEPKHPPCRTCNEEWDGTAVFCSYCGYEDSDEENPLHQAPAFTSGVYDAAGVLSDGEITSLQKAIAELASTRPVFFATFNTPDGYTPAGMAYTMYNDATVGLKDADEGILALYDPGRGRVEIAVGRKLGKKLPAGDIAGAASELAKSISEQRIAESFSNVIKGLLPK